MSTSLAGELSFQPLARGVAHGFRHPDKSAYSSQKSLPLVSLDADDLASLDNHSGLDCIIGAADVPRHLVRIWNQFYSRRVQAALKFRDTWPRLLSLFPGNTVLAPGSTGSFRYRGSLAFEQFLALFLYQEGSPHVRFHDVTLRKQGLDEAPFWPWADIAQPSLQFVTAEYSGIPNANQPNFSAAQFLESLKDQARLALNGSESPELACLKVIHAAWTDSTPPVYSKFAVAVASRVIEETRRQLTDENLLPFLFELETFASYETFVSRIAPVASGYYSNTWLDVGFMPLSQIRATELCVPERLIEEIFNIPARGFAPVVVNEFDSVADGNHRVTASWIWNILKHCMHTEWSLSNEVFLSQVRDYVNAHSEALGPVSLYESLRQLASFLADSEKCMRLNHVLKPAMRSAAMIRKLPVVMLPEYSMGTVEKESHDRQGLLQRVPPSLYEELAQTSDTVLPPRASYHFTDAVPMPWFDLVKHQGFNHADGKSEMAHLHHHSTPARCTAGIG